CCRIPNYGVNGINAESNAYSKKNTCSSSVADIKITEKILGSANYSQDNKNPWIKSLENEENWKIIGYDKIFLLFKLLVKIPGYESHMFSTCALKATKCPSCIEPSTTNNNSDLEEIIHNQYNSNYHPGTSTIAVGAYFQ
ncbi:15059_t:CDS:2, partial [Dentiscutata erythropus]